MINFFVKISDTLRYYRTVAELSRLSNKELEDLGLHRYEIVLAAAKANNLLK